MYAITDFRCIACGQNSKIRYEFDAGPSLRLCVPVIGPGMRIQSTTASMPLMSNQRRPISRGQEHAQHCPPRLHTHTHRDAHTSIDHHVNHVAKLSKARSSCVVNVPEALSRVLRGWEQFPSIREWPEVVLASTLHPATWLLYMYHSCTTISWHLATKEPVYPRFKPKAGE